MPDNQTEPTIYDVLRQSLRLLWVSPGRAIEYLRSALRLGASGAPELTDLPAQPEKPRPPVLDRMKFREALRRVYRGEVPAPPSGRLSLPQAGFWAAFAAMVLLSVGFRFYQLDTLQNEIYGDIVTVYDYVYAVTHYMWPFDFILSAGPVYHYLIWPILAFTGLTYWGLKLSSALVSLLALAFTYLLARELVDDWFAVLTTAIASVSSWLLIFSRLGNFPIIVPLLVMASLWLLVRYVHSGQRRYAILCSVVAGLGLYSYPETFVLPLTILLLLILLRLQGERLPWSDILWFLGLSVLFTLPLISIYIKDPAAFNSGYIGGKLFGADNPIPAFLGNLGRALGALHLRGDMVGRSNPDNLPHLDVISGLLFLWGLVFWFSPKRRRWAAVILLPFFLLQLPSVLVLASPGEVPSAARTLGIAPLAYLLVASGLWFTVRVVQQISSPRAAAVLGIALMALITGLNGQRYFAAYIQGLPYDNTPVAGLIADLADHMGPGTHIYLVGCCWDSGMPEPKGILYAMHHPEQLKEIDPATLSCLSLQALEGPGLVIWSEHKDLPSDQLQECSGWLAPQTYYSPATGNSAFKASPFRAGEEAANAPGPASTPPPLVQIPQGLVSSAVTADGRSMLIFYSPPDIGQVENIFDGDPATLMRGARDNPLVIEIHFAEPLLLKGFDLTTATMQHFSVNTSLTYADDTQAQVSNDYTGLPFDPTVSIDLPASSLPVKVLRLEIQDIRPKPNEGYHIHVRELKLIEP